MSALAGGGGLYHEQQKIGLIEMMALSFTAKRCVSHPSEYGSCFVGDFIPAVYFALEGLRLAEMTTLEDGSIQNLVSE